MQQKDLVEMLGREETMEMFLNGFARQVRLPSLPLRITTDLG